MPRLPRYQPEWVPLAEAYALLISLEWPEQAAKEDLVAAWKDGLLAIRFWLIEPDGTVIGQLDPRQVDLGSLTVDTATDWAASRALLPLTGGRCALARCEVTWRSVVFLIRSLMPSPPPIEAPPKAARRGGRYAEYDWDAFWVELHGRVHEHGLPEIQARLVEEMLQWFRDTYNREPAESEVQKRISWVYHRINDA